MDSERLTNKLEHSVTSYLFASFASRLASFKFASAESLGLARQVEPRFKSFAVRGGGT
jgi:hypothetical protein